MSKKKAKLTDVLSGLEIVKEPCILDECPVSQNTNPNLAKEYCGSLESSKCIHFRRPTETGERGMFSDPRGGQYYLS